MLVRCKTCHREYVASKRASDEHFICSRCQGRMDNQQNRLGLHPALERKWASTQKTERTKLSSMIDSGEKATSHNRASLSDMNSLPKIPGFEISYLIGRGAMGDVYCARQVKTGRLVAIKVLSCDLSERADLIARFEREAYALKSLNHPNVVSVIDAGHVGEIHYFAMEFIDGITLRARMNRAPIDIKEACFIVEHILSGLKTAHKHGIIHRDLKPENVLLAYPDRDFSKFAGRVVLVDFGLVGIGGVAFDPHPNLTRSRVTMGTVNYMAPEQHVDAKRVDHRSDLYSAGVIFFEMLTKELPLGRYLLPGERGMDVPQEVDGIIAKALARTVDERYASAEHFLRDLAQLTFDNEEQQETAHYGGLKKELYQWLKTYLFKTKYALMLVVAGLFFAFGVKMSKPYEKKTSPVKIEEKMPAKKV